VTLPLFVVIIAVAILGVAAGGIGDLVPAAPLAARGAPARGRGPAGADATGRSAGGAAASRADRSGFRRRRGAAMGPRARQAGRDVVEPAPSAPAVRSLPGPCQNPLA
jgi:hypothetical protein